MSTRLDPGVYYTVTTSVRVIVNGNSVTFEWPVCPHCKWEKTGIFRASDSNPNCNKCRTMAIREPQRFGRLVKGFGDFGELRKQHKAPHTEVFYIKLWTTEKGDPKEVYRSVNNATPDQISKAIRDVASGLEAKSISQENAELVLDRLYAGLASKVK